MEAGEVPPLFNITDEIRKAAALVAEDDAYKDYKNGTSTMDTQKREGTFWLGRLSHAGKWPWGQNDADFKVGVPAFLSLCVSNILKCYLMGGIRFFVM